MTVTEMCDPEEREWNNFMAKWMINDVQGVINKNRSSWDKCGITPDILRPLGAAVFKGLITRASAKIILDEIVRGAK